MKQSCWRVVGLDVGIKSLRDGDYFVSLKYFCHKRTLFVVAYFLYIKKDSSINLCVIFLLKGITNILF